VASSHWRRVPRVAVLFVSCSLALPSAAPAQTDEVFSLNVVGFQKITVTSNTRVMVATPFIRNPNTLDDVIGQQLTPGRSEGSADNIYMWNVVSQQYDRYIRPLTDSNWWVVSLTPVRATNVFLTPQTGFYIQDVKSTSQTETVILSGDVVDSPVVTNALVYGLNLVSYPYSCSIDINSSGLTNGRAGRSEGSSDVIYIWDPTGRLYRRYALISSNRKWWYVSTHPYVATVSVGAGQAFFYQRTTNSTFYWVETRPYSL
jgi:hypothetical protein